MPRRLAADRPRIVVCALGGDHGFLELPSSRLVDSRPLIAGGERTLYEVSAAAASLGYEVELRGDLNRTILRQVTDAAGVSPIVGLKSRPPERGEIVILPEGASIRTFAAAHYAWVKPVVLLLAPPGWAGWSFLSGWRLPNQLTVAMDAVGTAESYRAIDRLGFTVWTNGEGLAQPGRDAGIPVRMIGTGTPVAFPEPPEKKFDIAVIEVNRWHEWAAQLAAQVPGASVLTVPFLGDVYSLSEALGPARVLMWPSRMEGRSRIARESRAVGTVPVTLDTNPFSTRDDFGEGIVLVHDEASLVREATRLLGEPDELAQLARAGAASARQQAAWEPFVERLDAALEELIAAPQLADVEARHELGQQLRDHHRESALDAACQNLLVTRSELADEAARSDQLRVDLDRANAEIARYRSRRVVRIVDSSPIRHLAPGRRFSRGSDSSGPVRPPGSGAS